ncbi:shikimate kinase, partial [Streptomyces europaeiscabiei]|uniref:shikimate kinase n=1 Tax=Streptomyces europaeiscabiei TaxID=146819 RepID=UPI000AE51655
ADVTAAPEAGTAPLRRAPGHVGEPPATTPDRSGPAAAGGPGSRRFRRSRRARGQAGVRPVAVLVGLPGAGKSTVGRLMADRLGVAFRDTDDDIEHRTGRSVAEIFASAGERRFRILERAAVRAALAEHDGVLALGGGAVIDPATRTLLRNGPVVHVDADVQEVLDRGGAVAGRPLLNGDAAARLRELAVRRAPLYREVACVTVGVRGRSAAQVTRAALAALGLHPAA